MKRFIRFLVGCVSFGLAFVSATEAAARTSVRVEGTTVIIHVPIEIQGITQASMQMPNGTLMPAAAYIEREVERIWNEAFRGFTWADCLTFRLDAEIIPVERGTPPTKGRHSVRYDSSKEGSYWQPTGLDDMVPDRDFPFAYSRDMEGVFSTADPGILAHEIGHALGLGDDYFKGGGRKPGASQIGREAGGVTFIDENGTSHSTSTFGTGGIGIPDPAHVARVVAMMKEAGVLPQCWKGALDAEATAVWTSPDPSVPPQRCSDSWRMDITVLATAAGELSGDAHSRRASPLQCAIRYAWEAPLQSHKFQIKGSREGEVLRLRFLTTPDYTPPGGVDVPGFNGLLINSEFTGPLDIPITGNTVASGSVTRQWSAHLRDHRNSSGRVSLRCTTC